MTKKNVKPRSLKNLKPREPIAPDPARINVLIPPEAREFLVSFGGGSRQIGRAIVQLIEEWRSLKDRVEELEAKDRSPHDL